MMKNLIFANKLSYGGPGSFQIRFIKILEKIKVKFSFRKYKKNHNNCLIVFAGTKNLLLLFLCKMRGIKIVHRLDGIIWQHRIKFKSIPNFLISEIRLILIFLIRRYFADKIIYQSMFCKKIWQKYDYLNKPSIIINNGCSVRKFVKKKTKKKLKFISVEGELNCEPMYHILDGLSDLDIDVYGKYEPKRVLNFKKNIKFKGPVSKNYILKVLPRYDVFLTLEVLPPCSNSIIEAMSFGLPIFGYKTGSNNELVKNGGLLADYNFDPWKMELPDLKKLRSLLPKLHNDYQKLGYIAWKRHKKKFNITEISKKYIDFCFSKNN